MDAGATNRSLDARRATLILIAIVLAAAALRLATLTTQSLWWDEVVSWQQSRLDLAGLLAATAADNYPPLQNLIIHVSMRLFGETEFGLRFPSALLGIANVAAIYWVGSLFGGRRVGLIAAGLLALSGFHIWYSGEARMYALLALTATLFAGCSMRFAARPGWLWAILSVLTATALLYSHPYGGLTWGAIAAGVALPLALRRSWRTALVFSALQILPLALFAPWAVVLMNRAAAIDAEGFWIPPVTPWVILQHLVSLLSGPLLLAAFGVAVYRIARRPLPEGFVLLAAWVVLPLAAGVALSLLLEPMLLARYLIGSLPALLIIIALGFADAGRLPLAALAVAALSGPFFGPEPRDDLRSVAAALDGDLRPTDCLMTLPGAANGLAFYYREPIACVIETWSFSTAAIPAGTGRVFVMTGAAIDPAALGLDRLGTVTGRQTFGVTALVALDPK